MFMLSGSRKPRESGIVAKARRTNQDDPIPAAMSVVKRVQLNALHVNEVHKKVLVPPSRAVSPRVAREPFPSAKRNLRAFRSPCESKIMGSSLVLSNLRREREEREPKMVVHYKVHNPWDWEGGHRNTFSPGLV